jgi:type II secretory pathway pseudopilin PulG
MSNDEGMIIRNSNGAGHVFRYSGFGIDSSFVIRISSFRAAGAFTIIELLVVISIIIVLAGLILATSGYVTKKGARSRAEAEIAAMSAALESYKADNGVYARDPTTTDAVDPRTPVDFPSYQLASRFLYGELSGDKDFNGRIDPVEQQNKSYFTFKPQMLGITKNPDGTTKSIDYIRDPFGNSYGYSTAYQTSPSKGYNPTFDLWSTATSSDAIQWIKNW